MWDRISPAPLPTSQFRGRSLDREGLSDLIETDELTALVRGSRRTSPFVTPCGHVWCGEDAFGEEYPDTASWLSDGGCIRSGDVSAAAPAGGVRGRVDLRNGDWPRFRVGSVTGDADLLAVTLGLVCAAALALALSALILHV